MEKEEEEEKEEKEEEKGNIWPQVLSVPKQLLHCCVGLKLPCLLPGL